MLAKRGHNVTVVSPHTYNKVPPGITEIVLKYEEYEKFMQKASDDLDLFFLMIQMSINLNRQALQCEDAC